MVDGTSCALRANLAPRTVYARGLHMLGGSLYELRYLKKTRRNYAILVAQASPIGGGFMPAAPDVSEVRDAEQMHMM